MFLPSQLVGLSRRFQSDIEDLQVLLQEEGLPVQSAECLQQLSTRLGSDARFRRDVAFLVRSMLGRERDEPGSMDVLGMLVVAAAGTRGEFDSPLQQQLMRELLRFVIQQRRPAAAPAVTPVSAEVERPDARPIATGSELHSPAPFADGPNTLGTPRLVRAELRTHLHPEGILKKRPARTPGSTGRIVATSNASTRTGAAEVCAFAPTPRTTTAVHAQRSIFHLIPTS